MFFTGVLIFLAPDSPSQIVISVLVSLFWLIFCSCVGFHWQCSLVAQLVPWKLAVGVVAAVASLAVPPWLAVT